MGMRKIRNARVTNVSHCPHYHYEARQGIKTLVNVTERVRVVLEVTDTTGPEAGREIEVRMTRQEALEHIRRLTDAIQEGRDRELASDTVSEED